MSSIKEIAREANVSPSTVSKALNDRFDVSESTRKKILEIANQRHYEPSAIGKSLKLKKTENIGVIFCRESKPLSQNPFYSRVLEGIEGELAINNFNLVLHLLQPGRNAPLPKMVREKQVDGIILVGVFDTDFIDKMRVLNSKIVLVDPKIPVKDFSRVLIDSEHGGFLAAQYLVEKGHKRIGFISGSLERISFHKRYDGYLKALSHYRLPFDKSLVQTGGLEDGYKHMTTLLKMDNPPTAVFSANDINAIFAYKAVTDMGLRIPEDISIVGFDDIDMAKFSNPPLTTILVYKEEIGSIAVRNLLRILNNDEDKEPITVVPTKLIERESVLEI